MKKKTIKFLCALSTVCLIGNFILGCGIKNQENNTNDLTTITQSISGEDSEIHFLDTGNSDCILIKCNGKNILIDGGENNDEKLVVQYLKSQGVEKLDYIIATHPHADHIGGLDAVINNVEVSNLLVANGDADTKTYRDFIEAAANKGLNPSVPIEGAKFYLGNSSYMEIFNTNGGSSANEQSLVTLFVNGEDKFLFTGDAEKGTEKEILDNMEDIDVLKVGHHGSKTSTSDEFLEKVNPEYAVITVGENNSYNHPSKNTMTKLEDNNIKVYRTDECGNIIFKSSGQGVSTENSVGSYSYRD